MLMSTCNSSPVIEKPVEVIRTDSIYVHTTDTITNIIKVPIKTIEYIDSTTIDSTLNGYSYGGQDSLLTYSIWVESKERPIDVKLEYELKNFTISDTIYEYVRDSVYQEAPIKRKVSLGAVLSGSINSFGFSPMIDYQDRKDNTFKVGYDVIQKQYRIGYSKTIFKF